MSNKKVILTGDRPTGQLHVGHYVGSLRKRVELQNCGEYEQYILIADIQALTDNAENPQKIRDNLLEVALDYLAVGLDPNKSTICVQSQIPALFELPMYYANLVTVSRLQRNPTIKSEIQMRNFEKSVPVGFLTYPISQAADITAFKANLVPVGIDQLPVIEQTREIVSAFNRIYKTDILVEPNAVLPDSETCYRLVGLDGNAKMSKSLGNAIYLSDEQDVISKKIMGMFTDPNHLRVEDQGNVEGNPVFIYIDAFCKPEEFKIYTTEYETIDEMKAHYRRGGLGDVKVKKILNLIIQDQLEPIRNRRKEYEKDKAYVFDMLQKGTQKAIEVSNKTLQEVRSAIGVDYFKDENFIREHLGK